jgi:hypothetical protein
MNLVFFGIGAALAGDIFVVSQASALTSLDTRDLTSYLVGGLGVSANVQRLGGSYNSVSNEFVVSTDDYFSSEVYTINISSGRLARSPLLISTQALAFDPTTSTTVAFGSHLRIGAWNLFTGTLLFDPGISFSAADWFNDGSYIVGRETFTGDFYRVDAGMTVRLAPSPTTHYTGVGGLAYDSDTNLFWWFDPGFGEILFIEPQTWSVVGVIYTDLVDGAGGSIDTVLPQTPELLVTGACPGTVYLTVVDATPGQHVQFASGTTPGTRTVRRGPCAGVQGDLQNPTPRFDLIANDYGIASTTIQATTPMCGAGLVQAIDVATCLTTSVRTIPDGPLMLSL